MKRLPARLVVLCCLLAPLVSPAQSEQPVLAAVQQKISAAFAVQFKNYPQEKAFLQTSQNVYLTGQTLWYKAYAMAYGKPSQLSKVVYVRLSNAKGRLIRQDKLPLKNSVAYGNIDLPDTLRSGWYTLQVFTAWMLNFDRGKIFGQPVYIQNSRQPFDAANVAVAKSRQYHIDFFPEGGKLIDGVISNIAFKAIDGNGEPVSVFGDVLNDQKKPVAKITAEHDGMGSFNLETYANAGYVAQVHFPDNSVQDIPLPGVEKAGISFRVNTAPAGEIDLLISYTAQQRAVQPILVEAVQDDGLAIAYPLQLSRGINVFALKKNNFSNGVLHLGAFDESGRLVAGRSVFIYPADELKITLKADSISFLPGGQNKLSISLMDSIGMPVSGNFSVAVTDADMGPAAPGNISSCFLLGPETGAYLHDPGYYLKNNSDSLRRQLDLVMLTGSVRTFDWDDILSNNAPALKYAVEQSQFIAGRIEKYTPGEDLKLKMMIASADSDKLMACVEPDSSGIFKLDNYNKPGNAVVFYEGVNRKNRKQAVDVTFFNEDIDTVNTLPAGQNGLTRLKPDVNPVFLDSMISGQNDPAMENVIMLKAVTINQLKADAVATLIKSHVKQFDEASAQTLDMVDGPTVPNQRIFDYINGRFPGLVVLRGGSGNIIWKYHGENELPRQDRSVDQNRPSFYVDESQVQEDDIDRMSMTDVAMIRFIPAPVWFAPLGGGFIGALMIYTKNHDDYVNSFKTPHAQGGVLDEYTFNGYAVAREFSRQDEGGSESKPGPGFRTTLLWGHDVQTDANGVARVHFVANGKTKKYRVVLQGMDKDGHLIYLEKVLAAPVN